MSLFSLGSSPSINLTSLVPLPDEPLHVGWSPAQPTSKLLRIQRKMYDENDDQVSSKSIKYLGSLAFLPFSCCENTVKMTFVCVQNVRQMCFVRFNSLSRVQAAGFSWTIFKSLLLINGDQWTD